MPSLHNFWKLKSLCSRTQSPGKLRSISEKVSHSSFDSNSSFNFRPIDPSPRCSSSFKDFSPFPGSVPKSSEVAESSLGQGKPLSASEAFSRVFSTPSVHGPVWQSFGYHSCPILVDKNQTARSRQALACKITSATCGLPRGRYFKLEAKFFHIWGLDFKLDGFSPAIVLWKRREDQKDGIWEEGIQKTSGSGFRSGKQSELSEGLRLSWRCNSADAGEIGECGENKDSVERKKAGHRSTSQLHRLLGTSAAFHFLRAGPSLPAVGEIFQKAVHDATCRGAAVTPPGLVFDSSHEDENSEDKEKGTGGSLNSKGLRLSSGACCLPHPEKEETGGEDAYFICSEKQVVGVADGVGGWADVGVDAGEYARELMTQSMIAARQEPRGFIDPARVLERAHSKTICRGSSTACILALSDYGLQAANLGDSGFLIVRNGRMIFKSPAQQHQFNLPFQLENGGSDPPSAAEVFTLEVEVGDVIVAGTDGVFDNLYDAELTSIVVHATRAGLSPDIAAQKIASLARVRAQDRNRQTPFSTAAQDAGFRFYGGKMDDITVVVSYITNSKPLQDSKLSEVSPISV